MCDYTPYHGLREERQRGAAAAYRIHEVSLKPECGVLCVSRLPTLKLYSNTVHEPPGECYQSINGRRAILLKLSKRDALRSEGVRCNAHEVISCIVCAYAWIDIMFTDYKDQWKVKRFRRAERVQEASGFKLGEWREMEYLPGETH